MDIHLPMYESNLQMTPDLWKLVEFFNVRENWGSPYRMNVHLIFYVDLFRKLLGSPVDIYNAYELAGHSPTGEHPKGLAVDLSPREATLWDAYMLAMRLPFTGVGLYRWWTPRSGLHLDCKRMAYDKPKRVWYRDKLGIYHNIHTYNDLRSCFNEE